MNRRRILLSYLANSFSWELYSKVYFYNELVPTTINSKNVLNKAKIVKVSGNGVIENQLVQNGNFDDVSTWNAGSATYSVSNNIATITPTAIHSNFRQTITITNGHKYLYSFDIKYTNGEQYYINVGGIQTSNTGNGAWEHKVGIITPTNSNNAFNIYDYDNNIRSTWQLKNVMLIDLTLMFGTGNEPTTLTDNRIQNILNRGYIAFNLGKYKESDIGVVSTTKADTTALDTITFKAQVGGAINSHNTMEITNTNVVFTKNVKIDDMGNLLWSISDASVGYYGANVDGIDLAISYAEDLLCSKYAAFSDYTAFQNGDKGIFKYATQNTIRIKDSSIANLSNREQIQNALKGQTITYKLATPQVITIPRKHLGIVDLGSLNWIYDSGNTRFRADLSSLKEISESTIPNAYCEDYLTIAYQNNVGTNNTLFIFADSNNKRVFIRDSKYTNATDFKNAMSGQYLFYETENEVADIENVIDIESGGTITTDSEVLPNIELSVKCK